MTHSQSYSNSFKSFYASTVSSVVGNTQTHAGVFPPALPWPAASAQCASGSGKALAHHIIFKETVHANIADGKVAWFLSWREETEKETLSFSQKKADWNQTGVIILTIDLIKEFASWK